MTQQEKSQYEDAQVLKDILKGLRGRKFRLDCGHHITFGHNLGNDITIYNGKTVRIVCSLCGY